MDALVLPKFRLAKGVRPTDIKRCTPWRYATPPPARHLYMTPPYVAFPRNACAIPCTPVGITPVGIVRYTTHTPQNSRMPHTPVTTCTQRTRPGRGPKPRTGGRRGLRGRRGAAATRAAAPAGCVTEGGAAVSVSWPQTASHGPLSESRPPQQVTPPSRRPDGPVATRPLECAAVSSRPRRRLVPLRGSRVR